MEDNIQRWKFICFHGKDGIPCQGQHTTEPDGEWVRWEDTIVSCEGCRVPLDACKNCRRNYNDLFTQKSEEASLPTFLMLIGVPGSGKSHWLNSLEKKCMDGETYLLFKGIPFLVVCPDTIRQSLGSISDQSQNVLVWKKAKDSVIGCLENGTSVILDATNVNTAYRRDFISGLPKCRMLAKIFHATPAVAWERVKKDLTLEVDRAAVPEETIYRMFGEFLYTVKVLSSEGFEIRGE